jgi:hypothetical protein
MRLVRQRAEGVGSAFGPSLFSKSNDPGGWITMHNMASQTGLVNG